MQEEDVQRLELLQEIWDLTFSQNVRVPSGLFRIMSTSHDFLSDTITNTIHDHDLPALRIIL